MFIILIGLTTALVFAVLINRFWGRRLRTMGLFKNLDLSFRGMIIAMAILIMTLSVTEVMTIIPLDQAIDVFSSEAQVSVTETEIAAITSEDTAVVGQGTSTLASDTNSSTNTVAPANEVASATEVAPASEAVTAVKSAPVVTAAPVTKQAPIITAAPATKPAATVAPATEPAATSAPATKPATATAAPAPQYADGTFTGSGFGFRGAIDVEVTISSGQISDVIVTDHHEDMKWYNRAYYGVVERILAANSSNVDSVSGATYSSIGIIDGVNEALEKSKAAKK